MFLFGLLATIFLAANGGWAADTNPQGLTGSPPANLLLATVEQDAAILGAEILLLESDEDSYIYLPLILS